MIGCQLLRDLRLVRDVTIAEGIVRIEAYWFECSYVERVTVPTSVREIGYEAFRNCVRLREVVFVKGSRLREIEP